MEQKKEDKKEDKHNKSDSIKEAEKPANETEKLIDPLEEKLIKIAELTDTLKRLQAEFENFKKRTDKEKLEFMKFANARIIGEMLPVIDSFELALKNTADKEKFVEGIKMIYAQLHSLLAAEGLKPIQTAKQLFNPYRHEVLMKEASEKPEGTILEEFQKGYMLNDKVLRFTKVKISGK